MKHFLAIENHSREELEKLLEKAAILKGAYKKKENTYNNILKDKYLVSLFFNPSTRTKISFDFAMNQLGGHNITIEPGKSSWGIEIQEGAVMDKDAEEHLKDATNVFCRYADAIAIRCFPEFVDWDKEKHDPILKNMVKWSSKPIINMETITHPCQAMAMMLTIKEVLGKPERKKCVVTWAYHPKPLNTAVANSAGVIASMFGMDLVVANPPGYDLDPYYLNTMKSYCEKQGSTFSVVHDMDEAMKDADFVYVKSWGSLQQYGDFKPEIHNKYRNWIVNPERMALTNNAYFSHCLPLRRNMLASDEVIDSPQSLIYEEAENRLHVQKSILINLLGE